jgi:hypothetical protein
VGRSTDPTLHELMLELDRLEELREDLDELGITTYQELVQKIEDLSRQIDELAGDDRFSSDK